MPKASHRLDLLLVPENIDADAPTDVLWEEFVQRGWMLGDGAAGPHGGDVIAGGFVRARVDRPSRIALFANALGGFRVGCPVSKRSIVPAFSAAYEAFRTGAPRELCCPACGAIHALESLDYAPAARYGRMAIWFADVATPSVSDEALALVRRALGPVATVLKRVG